MKTMIKTMIEERIDKLIKTYEEYIEQDKQNIERNKKVLIDRWNDKDYRNNKIRHDLIEECALEINLFETFIESLKYAKTGERE